MSFALATVACSWDAISFAAWQYRMYLGSTDPSKLRPLLNEAQYKKQTDDHTRLQLEKLRSFLKKNPDEVMSTHPSTEVLVRRFRAGKPHYRAPEAGAPKPSFLSRALSSVVSAVGAVATIAAAAASVLVTAALVSPDAMPTQVVAVLEASGIQPVVADLRAVLRLG